MTATINELTVLLLLVLLVASVILIICLVRVNRMLARAEKWQELGQKLASEAMQAFMNMGTISAHIHKFVESWHDHHKKEQD